MIKVDIVEPVLKGTQNRLFSWLIQNRGLNPGFQILHLSWH